MMATGASSSTGRSRSIWILTHRRVGDLNQLRALAALLGWPSVEKRVKFRWPRLAAIPALAVPLFDRRASAELTPPWPDLVLCAESRTSTIARLIKRWSGGKTRVVCVGRPAGGAGNFDLVITSAQFRLPAAGNVVELPWPLRAPGGAVEGAALARMRVELSVLPRPWTAVLVGGTSPPDTLDVDAAREMARLLCAEAKRSGGSLLITTSARTGAGVEDAIAAAIDVPAKVFLWSRPSGDNPYGVFLELADQVVVTSDSASMAVEAMAGGRPVGIFKLPQRWGWRHAAIEKLFASMASGRSGVVARVAAWAFDKGVIEVRPDRPALYRRLVERGWLAYFPSRPSHAIGTTEMDRAERLAVKATEALFRADS